MGNLNRLYATYKSHAQFYLVYIREAHPADGWQVPQNQRDQIIYDQPKSDNERLEVAHACVRRLGITFPALVDGMDNKTEQSYSAWPDRLYVIGKEGKISFKGGPGPGGFKCAELETFLRTLFPEVAPR